MLLHYFDNKKKGPVVFFIHGTASANGVWEAQYKLFSKLPYRLIGVDLRGHGNTRNPGGICTLEDHLTDLKETIDHLKLKKPIVIIGHSFGALLATKYAERYPKKVSKLGLVSLPARVPRLLCLYYKWLLGKPIKFFKKKMDLVMKLPILKRYKFAIASDLNILRQIWRESLYWDLITKLPKVTCPIHFSVGKFDYIALRSLIEKLHKHIPNSTLKVFERAAHSCMEEQPHEFNQWVLSVVGVQNYQQDAV